MVLTEFRQLGLILGLAVFLYFFLRFRRASVSRSDFLLALAFSGSLILVSLAPGVVTLLRDMLALEDRQFSRLIAISILSNVVLWFLVLHGRIQRGVQRDQFDRLVRQVAVDRFRWEYADRLPLSRLAVVLPAFNEAENIGRVLDGLPETVHGIPLSAIVVDDGSDDGTPDRVREKGVPVVSAPVRRGGGAALRIGFDIAHAGGAEIAISMDADGQHLGDDIAGLVAPILEDRADFVIGSRFLGEREKDSATRLAGIHVFNTVIRILTPVRVTDCSNGFRALKLSALRQLKLRQDQYHTTELIIEAAKKKMPIGEAPVTVKRRHSGESKKGRNWKYGMRFAWTIFRTWWR